jgi:RHS repeat-associated protein
MADHLGSTRMLTDASGNQSVLYDYAPFGEVLTTQNGRDARWGAAGSGVHFTSKEQEGYEGDYLHYFGARYFSGGLGRFTSPDPEGLGSVPSDPQSWNMYAYGRNNPLRYTDPFGMNYSVCDSEGKNCADLTDKQYNQYLQSINGTSTYVTPGGTINVQNANGSTTTIGSATYYDEKKQASDAQGARQIAGTAAVVEPLLAVTLAFVGGPGMSALDAGLIATLGMLGGRLTPPGPTVEPSTPVGRGNTREWNTNGSNVGTVVNGRFYSGHALDQMQSQGLTPSVVEDTIARGTMSPGNTSGTWKYSTGQASVVVNRGGNVVTVHAGGR